MQGDGSWFSSYKDEAEAEESAANAIEIRKRILEANNEIIAKIKEVAKTQNITEFKEFLILEDIQITDVIETTEGEVLIGSILEVNNIFLTEVQEAASDVECDDDDKGIDACDCSGLQFDLDLELSGTNNGTEDSY